MKECKECGIYFSNGDNRCPLCHKNYPEEYDDYAFPKIPMRTSGKFLKILLFISIAILTFVFAINYLLKVHIRIFLYTLMIIISMWIVLYTIIVRRRNILKTFLYQMVLCSILLYLWDLFTGGLGWAVSFAIPIMYSIYILVMFIVARALKQKPQDYIFYYILANLIGLLPIFPLIFKDINPTASVVCVVISFISLSGMLIFKGGVVIEEIKRKFSM